MAVAQGKAHWSSRWTFIMAAVGSAVGLGNIWKFPYEAGSGGGGAFVIIYLAFIFLIGTPVLVAELAIGRRGQMSPIGSMSKLAREEKRSQLWSLIGWSGVIGSFIVISFYSVVGGWTIAYIEHAISGVFSGIDAASAGALFGKSMVANEGKMIFWHAVFMFLTISIVSQGVADGLEKAVTFLMPALFALLVIMVIYSATTADFGAALNFLFAPDFSKLTVKTVLEALGQSFFSLSLALGSIMTYGAYLTRETDIGKSALTIASADTMVAILAGLAIFPIVFSYGLDVSSGPGLIFATLPIAFGQMPLGELVGTLFFGLLAVAAITSAISLLEPSVSYVEERLDWGRSKIAMTIGLSAFVLGLFSIMGQEGNTLGHVTIGGKSIMDAKDYLTNNLIMPIAGTFTALFVGWFVSRKTMMEELAMQEQWFGVWYFLVRYICPVAVAIVFITLLLESLGVQFVPA